MIFSSSLGNVEKYATDVAIKSIANHLRKLQDELEYRLSNLDSTNINEIDTDDTVLTGGAATQISQSAEDIAKLQLTEKQILASVESLENSVSSVQIRADSITSTVNAQGQSIATLQQTSNSLTATVTAQGGDISTLKQTATGLTSTVEAQGKSISTLQQTSNSLSATVQTQGQSISTLQQTSSSLSATVTNLGNSMSQTVRLSADGVTITNAAGSKLTIDGGQINAKKINTDDLNLTGKITFTDLDAETQAAINKDNTKEYLASIGITEITSEGVKAPLIEGGEIRGAEIYGGTFGDLEKDNFLNVWSSEYPSIPMVMHMMAHYVGDASSSLPLTAMGWQYVGGEGSRWFLSVLGQTILEVRDGVVYPQGVWNFAGSVVMGI